MSVAKHRLPWPAIGLLAVIAGLAGYFLIDKVNQTTSKSSSREAAAALARTQVRGCEFRQVRDAASRAIVEKFLEQPEKTLLRLTLPMLDCARTFAPGNEGRPVRLAPELGLCFVQLTARGYFSFIPRRSATRADYRALAHQPETDPGRLEQICLRKRILPFPAAVERTLK